MTSERDGALVRVELNRPEARNALDEELVHALTDAFLQLADDQTVRAITLSGTGPAFCAGADLAYMARTSEWSREANLEDARALARLFEAIESCPKPTIARVHGAAIGGGIGLFAACDIAIVSEKTKLAFTEVRLGLAPATIAPSVIERTGAAAARALFLLGAPFTTADALRIGLVDRVVSAEELDDAISECEGNVLEAAPGAVAATKTLLRQLRGVSPAGSADLTSACIADLRAGDEAKERIRRFLDARRRRS